MTSFSYCPHDEGETCTCAVELGKAHVERAVIPPLSNERKRVYRPQPGTDGRSCAPRRALVKQLWSQGLTALLIARQTGMHVRTVERHLAALKRLEMETMEDKEAS